MMGEETTWNMQSIDSNKEYSIMLYLVGYIWRKKKYKSDFRDKLCKSGVWKYVETRDEKRQNTY